MRVVDSVTVWLNYSTVRLVRFSNHERDSQMGKAVVPVRHDDVYNFLADIESASPGSAMICQYSPVRYHRRCPTITDFLPEIDALVQPLLAAQLKAGVALKFKKKVTVSKKGKVMAVYYEHIVMAVTPDISQMLERAIKRVPVTVNATADIDLVVWSANKLAAIHIESRRFL